MSDLDYADVTASGAEGQANLNIWLKDVSVYVPGIVRSVLKRQLILACREFFEQSWAWRATLGPIPLVAHQKTYMLSPFNSTTDVVGVLGVSVNGIQISPIAAEPHRHHQDEVPDLDESTEVRPIVNIPACYYMVRPDIIAFYPTPNPDPTKTHHVRVLCALKPKPSVLQVPKIATTDFYDAILAGVLYRVLNQPAKPYSNPALSAYYESRFRTMIGTYAGAAKKGQNGGASWRYPYFGSPSNIGRSGGSGGGGWGGWGGGRW
jgi:hypothetical protein